MKKVLVVGGGIFGWTAALTLRERGWDVTVLERGQVPHPDAASTDISKLVRMDYGAEPLYTVLGEKAIEGWEAWNRRWPRPLYHASGVLMLAGQALEEPGFEHDSWMLLGSRGHELERFGSDRRARWPAWNHDAFPDGYLNPRGGWAESGAVVSALAQEAIGAGCALVENAPVRAVESGRVWVDQVAWEADVVLATAGSWVSELVPDLRALVRPTGHIVVHFRPPDPDRFRPPHFPPWAADIARTGFYGFPANADGIVKIGHHGAGVSLEPGDLPRESDAAVERARTFLRRAVPILAEAPLAGTRLCRYADTADGHFVIDRHPSDPRLVVASGGSGHAFKFAPVLGHAIADVVEGSPGEEKWRWTEAAHGRADTARAESGD